MKNSDFGLFRVGISVMASAVFGAGLFAADAHAAESPRINSFRTTVPSMTANNPMIFSWQAAAADSCSAYGGWSGAKGVTGNEKVAVPDESTTYGLECRRGGHSVRAQFQILVNPSQIMFDFTQSQQYALTPIGGSVNLVWRGLPASGICSMNASGMRITVAGDGSQTVSLPSEGTYGYRLDCSSPGMSINAPTITLVSYAPEKSRSIILSHVKDGAVAGKFQVASIRALNPANPLDPYADRVSPTNVRIDMRGRATVTGSYHYYPNTYGTVIERNRICMTDLDGASEQQLPRVSGIIKAGSRFCFNDGNRAAQLLGAQSGTSGIATVVIDGYTVIGDAENRPDETYSLSVSAHRQTAPIKVTVAVPKAPSNPNNSSGKPVIIYLQPNQVIRIENMGGAIAKSVVKTPVRKANAPVKRVQPKKKLRARPVTKKTPSSATLQPPKGSSTIKKVIPKSSTEKTEGKRPIATTSVHLYDAYIN